MVSKRDSNTVPGRLQRGFTLVEVMVALMIMAIVATLASQAFNTASSSAAATREAMERLAEIDRTFFLLGQDVRNTVPKVIQPQYGDPLPPVYVALSDDYWLTITRGGFANPLHQMRTEEVRVGYRYEGREIWRDIWYNLQLNEQDDARQQRLLTGVEDMQVRVLASNAASIAAGPWLQEWPQNGNPALIPTALEITLELEDMGEITRLYTLLPGRAGEIPEGNGNRNNDNNNDDGDSNEE